MKKAKIMLCAIAIVGVVGGAFAFKAKNAFTKQTYGYCVTAAVPATCSTTTILAGALTTIFAPGDVKITNATLNTNLVGTSCSLSCPTTDFIYSSAGN